jgi:hypothetical protein
MIILIDTEDKVIEVEKVIDKKDTKKLIRETLRNFDDFEHVVTPPVEIKFIPINKNFTIEDFVKKIISKAPNPDDISDIKPGPPRQ